MTKERFLDVLARLLPLVEPFQEGGLIIICSGGSEADDEVTRLYRERRVYHYYPYDPARLYPAPRLLEGIQE
ncbi:MAG: hypothetical protein V3V46_01690 [Anaerolineales bacterium]